MLRVTGQLEYMDIVITNEDVTRNKPHPDCYNLAIEKLKVDPSGVICVEDSEKGIQAANNSAAKHVLIVENCSNVSLHTVVTFLKELI
jgi:HAD superfamily hydrolase (TIGR01509 family)